MGSSASRMAETSSDTDCSSSRPIPPSLSTKRRTMWPSRPRLTSTSTSSKPRPPVTRCATALTNSVASPVFSPEPPKKKSGASPLWFNPETGTVRISGIDDPGHQVVGVGLGDLGLHEGPDGRGPVVQDDHAVDLRGLGGEAPAQQQVGVGMRALDQDLDPLPHPAAVAA